VTGDRDEEQQEPDKSTAGVSQSAEYKEPNAAKAAPTQQQAPHHKRHHKRHHLKSGRWHHHKRRLFRLVFIVAALALLLSSWAIYRSFDMVMNSEHGYIWKSELEQGHYASAASQFFGLTNDAISHIFNHDLSLDGVSADIKKTLPYLKKAGYTLTEVDIEIGVPPKVFVHFHHHGSGHVDVEHALEALHDNLIGKALVMAIAEAGKLQDKVEDPDMPFNHVEVELAPIPSVKIEYISPAKLHPWGNETSH